MHRFINFRLTNLFATETVHIVSILSEENSVQPIHFDGFGVYMCGQLEYYPTLKLQFNSPVFLKNKFNNAVTSFNGHCARIMFYHFYCICSIGRHLCILLHKTGFCVVCQTSFFDWKIQKKVAIHQNNAAKTRLSMGEKWNCFFENFASIIKCNQKRGCCCQHFTKMPIKPID